MTLSNLNMPRRVRLEPKTPHGEEPRLSRARIGLRGSQSPLLQSPFSCTGFRFPTFSLPLHSGPSTPIPTMASFVEELWSSVFTPGPTPTLLVATNVSFAALQLVLFALLLATYSIHFIVLSFLCAGLWYSINWFAHEVRVAQQAQEAEKKKQAETDPGSGRKKDSVDSADSDTETEVLVGKDPKASAVATGTAASARLQPTERDPTKRASGGDSSGYGSTDSEWEKVEDSRP